jgi:hypothetical protein
MYALQFPFGKLNPANRTTDEFENIAEDYRKFSQHQIPGSLKVCLVTKFGRSQKF